MFQFTNVEHCDTIYIICILIYNGKEKRYSSASGTLIIPETIDGYPITTIGQYAFAKKLKDYALSGGKLYNNLGVRHRDLIGTESMI